MAKTSKASIGITVTGDGVTDAYVPPGNPFSNVAAPSGGTTRQALTTGNDTVLVPTGAIGVLIAPPDATLVTLNLAPIAADQGLELRMSYPALYYFPAGTASFVLVSGAVGSVDLHWL